ncbi:MAG TPA: lysylphosphatidylglycerol synthase transmembrane domain-containing protein [Ktedonobacteraceae bacterium]|nr:lysylphosphatidylglycerol synthase transmembrane domain-containing protein [Ktedonobacteraceae bacterium]
MITENTSTSSASAENSLIEADATAGEIEKKQVELLQQEALQEPEITREQLSIGKRLLNWRTIVPLVIVIVALVFFAKQAHIDPHQMWIAIRAANIWFVLASFTIYYCSFPIRTLRWRMLLENVGYTKSNNVHLPKFPKLLEILYISWFANVIVPAKLGDLYRAYLLRKEAGLPTSRTFGTVLAERLLDLVVLLLLFIPAVIISLHENLPGQLKIGLAVTLALVAVGVIALFVLRTVPTQIARLLPARFRGHYIHFQEGTLGSFRRVPTLSVLTLGVWACESLRFLFIALAFGLIGGNLVHIVAAALFIALGEALLTVVPFTGGGVGLVEGGMFAMIALFTANTSLAAAAILTDRIISLFSILVFGFIVFMVAFGRETRKAALQPKSLT